MKLIKRELLLCFGATTFAVLCALAWGGPFVRNGGGSTAGLEQSQPQPSYSMAFKGIVARSGEQFLLRESSGQVFRLDEPQQVQPYEGRVVTVTGMLNEATQTIEVERIEAPMS